MTKDLRRHFKSDYDAIDKVPWLLLWHTILSGNRTRVMTDNILPGHTTFLGTPYNL